MIKNGLLTFGLIESNYSRSTFTVDLRAVAKRTGTKEYGEAYPISKAKKLCKLMAQHADPDDLDEISGFFAANPKLMKAWKDALGRARR